MNSFTGNTKVLLPGSKTIAISKVKAGQKVLATDPYTGKTAARQVAQVIRHHGVHAMALIALLSGGLIHATAHHPIYDTTTKTFTYAASLRPGDKLLEPSGSTIKITSIRDYTADLTAYNLNVTGIHTYYGLARTTPVLVHNSCGLRDNNYPYPKGNGFEGPTVRMNLAPGFRMDRFGRAPLDDTGRFASPEGSSYSRGLTVDGQ